MALSIDDFSAIANAILDAVNLSEQNKAIALIQEKLNELSEVEFEHNSQIQYQYILNIGKLKLARDRMNQQLQNYEPITQCAWLQLVHKLNERINFYKRRKQLHAKSQ